ncbi:MAG: hypothetical protein WBM29_05385, partial [Candidatus Deferrimicrobium sp.]
MAAALLLLLSGCAGAPSREPVYQGAPPASRPSAVPAPTLPGTVPRPGAVVASPSDLTEPRFIRVLLSGGAPAVILEGETVRAWGADGRLEAEAAGRVALA